MMRKRRNCEIYGNYSSLAAFSSFYAQAAVSRKILFDSTKHVRDAARIVRLSSSKIIVRGMNRVRMRIARYGHSGGLFITIPGLLVIRKNVTPAYTCVHVGSQ